MKTAVEAAVDRAARVLGMVKDSDIERLAELARTGQLKANAICPTCGQETGRLQNKAIGPKAAGLAAKLEMIAEALG